MGQKEHVYPPLGLQAVFYVTLPCATSPCSPMHYLPMNILAEAGHQPLYPQDQVTVMTQGVHNQFVFLIFGILVAVNQHHNVTLE